jgi:outer membrane receptor protein involved in Fe transport
MEIAYRRILFALAGLALTAATALAAPLPFDIPAEPAPQALDKFIAQSSMKVAYSMNDVKDVRLNAVSGTMEPADALAALLRDTGLAFKRGERGWYIVRAPAPGKRTGSVEGTLIAPPGSGRSTAGVTVAVLETGEVATADRRGHFDFPALAPGSYTLLAYGNGFSRLRITDVAILPEHSLTLGAQQMPILMRNGEVQRMEEVVVRASRVEELRPYVVEEANAKPPPFRDANIDLPRGIDDVQPYYIFDGRTLDESGTTNVEDFLKQRLTMDTSVQSSTQATLYSRAPSGSTGPTGAVSGASSINLNGLGTDHTLILVDGQQMAGVTVFTGFVSQPGQPDVNGIPFSAIDRIEVLPSSSGAIYGPGAEGGVIKIVLTRGYSGGEITGAYGATWAGHGPTRTVEASFGRSFERGKTQVFVTAQYQDSSPAYVQDSIGLINRAYATLLKIDPSYLGINAANPGMNQYYPIIGSTPNIASTTTYVAVPNGTVAPPGSSLVKNQAVGSYYNGAAVTAENPWVLVTPPQPLAFRNGVAVGGANPYIATLPAGYGPGSSPSSIIGGQWNLAYNPTNERSNGLRAPLANFPRRKSVVVTLTRQMTDSLQLHASLSNSDNYTFSNFNVFSTGNGVTIPAEAPINPFNQAVLISFPIEFDAPAVSNTVSNSISLGGTLKLPFDWTARLDYQWSSSSYHSTSTSQITNPFSYTSPIFNANDTYPTPYYTGAINPFVDTIAHPINLVPFTDRTYYSGKSTDNNLVFAASGPLVRLPWGEPRLSFRLEHDKSGEPGGGTWSVLPTPDAYPGLPVSLNYTYVSFGQTQTTDSANAELDLPIFKTRLPFLRQLDAQFNFRRETSTAWAGTPGFEINNGALYLSAPNTLSASSNEPIPASGAQPYRAKAESSNSDITGPAVSYKPFDSLVLRGSIATGYVPPRYNQLLPTNFLGTSVANQSVIDPLTGLKVSGVTEYNLGGNPNLMPQTSRSWDFGAIWEPRAGWIRGLRADVEFRKTTQENIIVNPSAQQIVDFEALYPNLVTRNSAGQITTVYTEWLNMAAASQESWTFSLDYPMRTAVGSFELEASETIQEHNKQQVAPGTPFFEYVGYPSSGGVAKSRATATLHWAWHKWIAAWTVNYYGGYAQSGAPGDPLPYSSYYLRLALFQALGRTPPPFTPTTTYTDAQGGYAVPSQVFHNLYVSHEFGKSPFSSSSNWGRLGNSLLGNVKVSLSINDIFNTPPAYDAYYSPFFASPYGDPNLRTYQLQLKRTW